jgi:hypothetical protein
MCFNDKVSLLTFVIGIIGSVALINYGNSQFCKENIISGVFLLFIAGIQLMDFLFWIDLKNNLGINKITTIIGPLFNIGQPLILYLIKVLYFRPKNIFSMTNYNLPVFILNALYFVNLIIIYISFLRTSKLITGTSNGHLSWPWIRYANPAAYLSLLAINIFYLMKFNYSLVFFLIIYFFLILSIIFFSYSPGELWCFFGSFIPLIMLVSSYFIK